MSVVRELVTLISFRLNGFREAEAAFRSLQAKAQQVGDIRFRATGVQQVEATIARLRDMARQAVPVPMRGAIGPLPAVGRVSAPAIAAPVVPTLSPMQVRLQGVGEANAALASLRSMAQSVTAAVAGIGAAMSVQKLVEAGDAYTRSLDQIRASLAGVGGSAEDVYESMYVLGRRTGASIEASTTTFVQLQSAVTELGGTSQQVLQVVEGMQQAGAIAGTKSRDIAEAMRQLGQGISSQKLNGDELRSIMERMPPLARALAKELGVPVGQLREMGSKGKLTSTVVWPALVRASGQFREQFERLALTFDRAKNIANVTLTRFLADLDQGIGLSQALAQGLLKFSNWLDGLRSRLPIVRAFIRDLGGIKSVLETVAIAASLATAAFFRFGLSLVVPAAVVLGITAVAVAIQDLYYWVQGRPSLLGDFFGDFGPVRERIAAAVGFVAAKSRELRDEVSQGLGFQSADDLFADIRRQFVEFGETSRREWRALKEFLASDDTASVVGGAFGAMAENARTMWEVIGPILRGLVGGPAEMAREWANVRAAIGDPLKAIGGFFDDIATRAGNVYNRIYELGQKLREFMAGFGLLNLTPGNGLPPEAVIRQRERDARGTEQFGPPAPAGPGPRATPDARERLRGGFGDFMRDRNGAAGALLSPSSYMQELPSRMSRAQTIAASQQNSIQQTVNITATGGSPAEVAAAAQSGVNRANRDAFGASDTFARGLGLDMARTELAAV